MPLFKCGCSFFLPSCSGQHLHRMLNGSDQHTHLDLIPDPGGKHHIFHHKYEVSQESFEMLFIRLIKSPSILSLFNDFKMKRYWILSNTFSSSTEKITVLVLYSIGVSQWTFGCEINIVFQTYVLFSHDTQSLCYRSLNLICPLPHLFFKRIFNLYS